MAKLGNIVVGVGVGDINLPSKSGGSSTPDEPSTLEFILIRSSSFVKSPLSFFCHQCIYEWCLNLMAHNMHWWHCRYAGRADAGSGAYAGAHLVRTLSIVAPALRCQHDVVPATSAIFCLFVKDEVPLFWASISLSPSPQAKKSFHGLLIPSGTKIQKLRSTCS